MSPLLVPDWNGREPDQRSGPFWSLILRGSKSVFKLDFPRLQINDTSFSSGAIVASPLADFFGKRKKTALIVLPSVPRWNDTLEAGTFSFVFFISIHECAWKKTSSFVVNGVMSRP